MKNLFFILIFALGSLSFANRIPYPGPPPPTYMKIHQTPVLVYGTISDVVMDENNNITAKLTVKQTIKGDIGGAKILVVSFPAISNRRAPVSTRPKTTTSPNETCIFGLYQNDQREWMDRGTRVYLNESGNIYISGKTCSLSDFKAGIALFERKYTFFEEKKANNISISLENPTKNKTFAFLAKEMMGDLIYIPKTAEKTQKGKVKPRKKHK